MKKVFITSCPDEKQRLFYDQANSVFWDKVSRKILNSGKILKNYNHDTTRAQVKSG